MNLREKVEEESSQFKSATDHAIYHLNMAHAVLFEKFEGRNNTLLDTVFAAIQKIEADKDFEKLNS